MAGARGKRQRADAALPGMQNNSWGLRRALRHKQQGNLSGKNRTMIIVSDAVPIRVAQIRPIGEVGILTPASSFISHQEMIVGFLQQLIIRIPKAAPAVSALFVRDEPQVLSTIKQKNEKVFVLDENGFLLNCIIYYLLLIDTLL